MPKTIYRREHAALLSLLKKYRDEAGLTQVQCSKALGRPQSFMSDVESGTRRLDVVQVRDLCNVLGVKLTKLAIELEELLAEEG
ncbi:helix-turn-helix transcriptional regulator [Pseudomonas sp. FJ2-5-13]|uniref:Helix-turn-helix domain-containing protein n=1 Tax=Pseudomonas salomonii TaxID=191391 RepID=A0A1H3J3V4_9PSED|nr:MULTISPECIES: helix-turn-helix transcriptional regulator [Pseudomonas]WEJ07111.1 helix-turn-helix transcriptional regulator [Pseudomonas sp. FJ2-5-13]SDY34487.1 Helix-turn-helix domain-containing protein [Pseudomonas salomonii]